METHNKLSSVCECRRLQTKENLRSQGFKTFHPYIDESYDDILDINERFREKL